MQTEEVAMKIIGDSSTMNIVHDDAIELVLLGLQQ
jgi:hypothetical protein